MAVQIFASLLIAVLSGMGVGSAGLFVIYLTAFTDTSQLTAQGLNLLFYIFSCGASLLLHIKKRRFFPAVIVWLILASVLGVIIGGALTSVVPVAIIKRCFGGMLIAAGISTLCRTFFTHRHIK